MKRLAATVLRRRSRATALTGLGASSYRVAYRSASVGSDQFFVPCHALQRPACRAVLAGRPFEPKTHTIVARLLAARPGSMVHAGAFFGDMLPSFSRACPATIYAFEPVLENYVLARATVEANGLGNVALVHAGLGADPGVAHVRTTASGRHLGGASEISAAGQCCALLTVDGLGLADLSVLQLDVEGHELEALTGARSALEANRPVVLVEDGPDRCPEFLRGLGYRLAGEIPGQKVWAPEEVAPEIAPLIP